MRDRVTIVEMGPRDGLQAEARMVPAMAKIELVDRLSACGFARIEVTSFVSPKAVPQMADAAEVMAGIERRDGVRYGALTPNLRGYQAARAADADEVAVFASASEGFSQRNINCSIDESLERFRPIMAAAAREQIPVRGYVSCITHCPYDGEIAPDAVAHVAGALLAMGCHEISLGDTIGAATPEATSAMLDAVLAAIPAERLAGHFHDTRNRALDNIAVCLERGLRVFDASIAGLGGCPFAPGAKGNVDTARVARMLDEKGIIHVLDLAALDEASRFARELVGHQT